MTVTRDAATALLRRARLLEGRVLAGLLVPVVLLLAGHLLHEDGVTTFQPPVWDMDVDGSAMEVYGYWLVTTASVLMLLCAAQRRGGPVYAGWAFALCLIVLDDALQWHERGGAWLVANGPVPDLPGLREQDFGELLVWTLLGSAVAVLLACTHLRSPHPARQDSVVIAALVLLLMVFGIGVDMFGIALRAVSSAEWLHLLVTELEGTGEAASMAALLAFSASAYRHLGPRAAHAA